jgi:hypothetical protein
LLHKVCNIIILTIESIVTLPNRNILFAEVLRDGKIGQLMTALDLIGIGRMKVFSLLVNAKDLIVRSFG